MCKHLIQHCALCTTDRITKRLLRDIEGKGGVPIPGFVAPLSYEYRGVQSFDTAPPVRPTYADWHWVKAPVRLEGTVSRMAPVGRPWWVAVGMTFDPATRIYSDGVPLDIEVPVDALDRTEEWQDF